MEYGIPAQLGGLGLNTHKKELVISNPGQRIKCKKPPELKGKVELLLRTELENIYQLTKTRSKLNEQE